MSASERSTGGRRPPRKPAGEHSLASEGGWLGLEFDVAVEILLKGDCHRSPSGKRDENRDALEHSASFTSPLGYLRVRLTHRSSDLQPSAIFTAIYLFRYWCPQ